MVEEDVMAHVGNLVGQEVKVQNRQTVTNKTVYRVTIASRKKVEALLKAILPFTVGARTIARINEALDLCEAYNQWVANGGPKKQAQLAARARANKNK
jgi:hypothetical protein